MPVNEKDLIIDHPGLQSRRQRTVSSVITLIAWTVWMYLWLPLITFIGWILGIRFFRQEVLLPDGYLGTLLSYLVVIVLLAAVFIGWALYNLGRFRGLDRRKPRPPVQDAEIAAHFDIEVPDLVRLRDLRRVIIHFSEEGKILQIEDAAQDRVPSPADESALPPSPPIPEIPSPARP